MFKRSGLTSSTSRSPLRTRSWISAQSATLLELIVAARTPARSAAATWLRIRANSGDTMTVAPCPDARSSLAAMKYTADLPQPVRCTTSARRRCTTNASIAVHWSSRSVGRGPGQLFEDRLRVAAGRHGPIVPCGCDDVRSRRRS